jgi:predicted dehydrogenase
MSAIAPLGERSMSVSGTRGAIHTPGLDPQEDQLAAGLLPGDEDWGAGEPAYVIDADGEEHTVDVAPGAYERFYAGVRDALRDGAALPVDPRDSLAGLRVIEAARRSARSAAVIDMTEHEEEGT